MVKELKAFILNIHPYNFELTELLYLNRDSSLFDLFYIFLPEICIFSSIILYFMTYFFKITRYVHTSFSIFYFFILIILISFYFTKFEYNYEFTLISYYYIWFAKLFLIIFVLFFTFLHHFQVLFAWYYNNQIDLDLGSKYFELNLIILVSLFSSYICISSNDFMLLLVSLEVLSLCLYIITSLTYEKISIEATLKYFFISIFFSFFIILGICFIYWGFHEFNFTIISQILVSLTDLHFSLRPLNLINIDLYNLFSNHLFLMILKKYKWLAVGLLFIIIGLLGKLGLFPGHFWVLDVYGNISVLSNAFLAVFPKIVYILLLIRLQIHFALLFDQTLLNQFYYICAIFSVIYGAFATLNQWRIKKFFASSSIINLGFLLFIFSFPTYVKCGCSSLGLFSLQLHVIFYFLFLYSINIYMFFFIYLIAIQPSNVKLNYYFEDFREFVQLKYNHKFIVFFLSLVFLSFAGTPPLMGFFPKYLLFKFLLQFNDYYTLFFIIFFTIISAFYYIRVIRFFLFSTVRVFGLFKIRYNFILYFLLFFFFFLLFFFFFLIII